MTGLKTSMKSLTKVGLALAAALLLMNPGAARAEIVLSIVTSGVPQADGNFLYSYNVTLTQDSFLHAGGGGANTFNNFTLYDVQGLVTSTLGGSVFATGAFTSSTPLTGVTPSDQIPIPPDSPTIPNIVGTFVFATDIVAPIGMDILLGTLSFESTNPLGSGMLAYTAATQKLDVTGAIANNAEQVMGPGGPVGPPVVPEPATLLLLITGLPALGIYYRRRNK